MVEHRLRLVVVGSVAIWAFSAAMTNSQLVLCARCCFAAAHAGHALMLVCGSLSSLPSSRSVEIISSLSWISVSGKLIQNLRLPPARVRRCQSEFGLVCLWIKRSSCDHIVVLIPFFIHINIRIEQVVEVHPAIVGGNVWDDETLTVRVAALLAASDTCSWHHDFWTTPLDILQLDDLIRSAVLLQQVLQLQDSVVLFAVTNIKALNLWLHSVLLLGNKLLNPDLQLSNLLWNSRLLDIKQLTQWIYLRLDLLLFMLQPLYMLIQSLRCNHKIRCIFCLLHVQQKLLLFLFGPLIFADQELQRNLLVVVIRDCVHVQESLTCADEAGYISGDPGKDGAFKNGQEYDC